MPHSNLLMSILDEARAANTKGDRLDVVFDIDSTLFCVSPRTEAILNRLSNDTELLDKFPEFTKKLAHLKATSKDWGIRTILERARFTATIEFFEALRKKWSSQFFSSDYLHIDEPYPGAIEYLNELHQAGARIRYLTGRDAPNMGKGTRAAFEMWKIPLELPEFLLMKPDTQRHDAEFKRDTLKRIYGEERGIWFFENEPVIINLVRKALPRIKIVFMDSVHSGREQAPEDLPKLPMSYEIKSKR